MDKLGVLFVLTGVLLGMAVSGGMFYLLAMLINYCFATTIPLKGAFIFGTVFPLFRLFLFPSRSSS